MKYRYVIPLIILTFVAGAAMSWYGWRDEISETNKIMYSLQSDMEKYFASINKNRAMDNLKTTIDVIGYVMAMDNTKEPRKYIVERYTAMLEDRMAKLESLKSKLNEPADIEYSESLLKEAKKLLEKIEFEYL